MSLHTPESKKSSRGERRLATIQQARLSTKTVAKSAAHVGVVARPMDQQLSHILDRKRAEVLKGGTSAARLGQAAVEVSDADAVDPTEGLTERRALVEANTEAHATQRATSVGRLRTAEGEMGLAPTSVRPTEPPDMAI